MKKTKADQPQKNDNQQEDNGEQQDNSWQEDVRRLRRWSYLFLLLAIIAFSLYYFNIQPAFFGWSSIIAFVVAILLFLPINYYIFDNKEYEPNETVEGLIGKLRLRAVLFNNLSVLVFIVTVFVIVCSFYLMIHAQTSSASNPTKSIDPAKPDSYSKLASQIGAVVILIFLVQILFRVFKYLLRVGAFYNGKADAIELSLLNPTYNYETLLDSFTPTSYDISDVDSPNLTAKP